MSVKFLNNRSLIIVLVLLMSLLYTTNSRAAFVVKMNVPQAGSEREITAISAPGRKYAQPQNKMRALKNCLLHTYRNNDETESDTGTTAILSLIFGGAGAVALIVGTANLLVWLLIAGVVFGVAGTILGAQRRHRYKGLGIAGLTLGIIDMALGMVLIPLVALAATVSSVF